MLIFIVPVIGVIVLVAFFAAEQHANNKRIQNGEPPVKHHDLTDAPPPVNVIDWSRRD
jgi:hypothetical protein